MFGVFRDWLRHQFEALGQPDADDLALHVLTFSQGVPPRHRRRADDDVAELLDITD
ncbi:hypothetical protein V5P93_003548 [Actinokineospora auranticolor]|uniref:Uncharacterized protein n=1 Tax=Actinokineospora auranticolor TaxID=155976 RepID=A0A2S6GQ13_9PSEU|nr:hypothetical protein [Actinokineospora auranticolor]PPK67211.1 hypothetical protein CLV40_108209 [Actinokineospora auranticolor]